MKLPRTTTTMGELFWGYFFVIIGSVSFFGFVFAVIASTFLLLSQNPLNQGLKNDRYYYCFLVPLTIPVITVAVYFHWLSMKLFKHAWYIPLEFVNFNFTLSAWWKLIWWECICILLEFWCIQMKLDFSISCGYCKIRACVCKQMKSVRLFMLNPFDDKYARVTFEIKCF